MSDKAEDTGQMRDIISELLAPAREARERAIAEHEAQRESQGDHQDVWGVHAATA